MDLQIKDMAWEGPWDPWNPIDGDRNQLRHDRCVKRCWIFLSKTFSKYAKIGIEAFGGILAVLFERQSERVKT